ncbi:hypothetical protein [Dethiobacter alkaliphilus]|uniref:Uncharacterized protein n=1 Tax=Dethiobacter alkaliphilus AHT 1 TaxID=555088 RepID=C0GGJ3_DETAL|nr:hypothetical protein [Dethiobacter alkaliphilus]EEG77434.1 hypothetical protein DealDRAFT_1557 [Dethiobacter alkaliphilus AHT 1]
MSAKSKRKNDAGAAAEKVTLEVVDSRKTRKLEFESEEDKQAWHKAFKKSRWYTPYFLLGVFFNYLLYRAGLDLSQNILWGMIVGSGIPIATMFIFTEIHYRLFIEKTLKS